MKTKVIRALTSASSGSKQKAGHNIVFNRTLYMLLSQQGMLRIKGTFKSNTQPSLTTQHMLASTRRQEAAHLQYRSVSNPQTPTPAPKGPRLIPYISSEGGWVGQKTLPVFTNEIQSGLVSLYKFSLSFLEVPKIICSYP